MSSGSMRQNMLECISISTQHNSINVLRIQNTLEILIIYPSYRTGIRLRITSTLSQYISRILYVNRVTESISSKL